MKESSRLNLWPRPRWHRIQPCDSELRVTLWCEACGPRSKVNQARVSLGYKPISDRLGPLKQRESLQNKNTWTFISRDTLEKNETCPPHWHIHTAQHASLKKKKESAESESRQKYCVSDDRRTKVSCHFPLTPSLIPDGNGAIGWVGRPMQMENKTTGNRRYLVDIVQLLSLGTGCLKSFVVGCFFMVGGLRLNLPPSHHKNHPNSGAPEREMVIEWAKVSGHW